MSASAGAASEPGSPEPPRLTHLDEHGRARMVDVGEKAITRREAVARARLHMRPETLTAILAGSGPKGDVLQTARIAGIGGAKKTADLIPLCHPLALDAVEVHFAPQPPDALEVTCTARVTARTGVEMEAMTGASVAALTIYDMVKAIDRFVTISEIALLAKSGGRSGTVRREERT